MSQAKKKCNRKAKELQIRVNESMTHDDTVCQHLEFIRRNHKAIKAMKASNNFIPLKNMTKEQILYRSQRNWTEEIE